jgi:hypothetical protein
VVLRTKVRGTDVEAIGRAAATRLLEREGGRGLLDLDAIEDAS